jgi:hypothetical protein
MKHVALRLLFLVAVAPALAACDPSLDLIQVPENCPDKPYRGPADFPPAFPEDVIDDFEDAVGPMDLTLSRVGNRNGSWIGYGSLNQATVFGEVSDTCVANGKKSGHLTGINLNPFGGNWNGVFVDPFGAPFDAHTYSGISFWVAAGNRAVPPLEMPIGLMTTDTAGPALVCNPCGDYYRVSPAIPLTRSWTRHVIKFNALAQSGMGSPQTPLKRDSLVSVMIWPQNTYDIWIDDVRFER